MPSTVRLRYVGAQKADVPVLAREVEPDTLVEFVGTLLTEYLPDGADKPIPFPEDADHYLIESGNPLQVRAWPKSQWRSETVAVKKVKE